jgi:AGCS family alanine or glycine:cation symporter
MYKETNRDNCYGGPSYYLEKGLQKRNYGILYAIILMISYIFGFVGIQANTISKTFYEIININPMYIALLLSVITALVIFGGLKKIIKFTNIIVTFMMLFYMMLTIYIIINNITDIPIIFHNIIDSAFNFKAIWSGGLGTIIIGIQSGCPWRPG